MVLAVELIHTQEPLLGGGTVAKEIEPKKERHKVRFWKNIGKKAVTGNISLLVIQKACRKPPHAALPSEKLIQGACLFNLPPWKT